MNLEKIQEMWKEDSHIDMDNLHDESIKVPQLHQKYHTLYTTIKLLLLRSEELYNKTRLERHNYYTGRAPAEVYVEDPFPYRVKEKDNIQLHLAADEKLSKAKMKVEYNKVMLEALEDILKMIHARGYQIKNSVDYLKFLSGMGL